MAEYNPTQLHTGLSLDTKPFAQPKGTYPFALNAVLETKEGDITAIANELGNELCIELEPGFQIVGHSLTDTDDIVIVATDNTTTIIATYNPDLCTYEEHIRTTCLGYTTANPVFIEFRIRKGCERNIYMTDRVNMYKAINLDDLSDYLPDGVTQEDANMNDTWDCDSFNLTPTYTIPVLDLAGVNDAGGQLKVGTYQFAIRLLDDDLNPSNWFYVTNPVPIVDEGLNSEYITIDGGIPIFDGAEPEDGSVPTTSKSITLSISSLDESAAYYQIAALHSTATTGKVSEVWLLEPQAVDTSFQQFTYTGPNLDIDTLGSLADIIIDNIPIEVVQHHTQADQALWLGGLSGQQYEYAEFQRAASKIVAKCIIKEVEPYSTQSPGDPKSPFTYWDTRTFMPDEIYSFGIQFLHGSSGLWSPVFHIPGRPMNIDPYTCSPHAGFPDNGPIDGTNKDCDHLPAAASHPRWKVYNTAVPITAGYLFAYHEASTNYPDIKDCDGNSIWGTDACDAPLVGTPIRHHRFPCRRQIRPVNTDGNLQVLGVQFDGVEYPSDDIVGHRFVMAKREEHNKTVLDNGLLFATETPDQFQFFNLDRIRVQDLSRGPHNDADKTSVFVSPKTLVRTEYLNGTHFKFTASLPFAGYEQSLGLVDVDDIDRIMTTNYIDFDGVAYNGTVTDYNVAYDSNIYVAPRSFQTITQSFPYDIHNEAYSNTLNFYHHVSELDFDYYDADRYVIATNKKVGDPYSTLNNQTYLPLGSTYYPNANQSAILYTGDAFLTNLSFYNITDVDNDGFFTEDNTPDVTGTLIRNVWVDSEINFSLRHGGTTPCTSYYKGSLENSWQAARDRVYQLNPENNLFYISNGLVCPEYYGYNNDYSKVLLEKPAFSLPYVFNYCSQCLNSYPDRIRASKRSYQEEIADNYRIFAANDYVDITGMGGGIQALVVDKDELYALNKRYSYFVPTRPQTIQTNETLTYLGTGERLSIPPRRLATPDFSYGGTKHATSVVSTEFGSAYVDSAAGKIFLISSSLTELSNSKIRNWLRENMNFELIDQYAAVYGEPYPLSDNITHSAGLGIQTVYDPRHRRLIVHSKNYVMRPEVASRLQRNRGILPLGAVYWDETNQRFLEVGNATTNLVQFINPDYFINKSWTLSYHFPTQSWASFHSYLPSYMWNDHDTFYSTNADYNVWTHNRGEFQTYYGTKHPYIIDFIVNDAPAITKTHDSMSFVCDVELFDTTTNQWFNSDEIFFDQVNLYNAKQNSGLLDILIKTDATPFLTTQLGVGQTIAERVERTWQMSNNFRDRVIDYTVPYFSAAWDDINTNYFIDKVVNSTAVDVNKSDFEAERMRDKWLGCRLFFNPTENAKITTDLILTQTQMSYR